MIKLWKFQEAIDKFIEAKKDNPDEGYAFLAGYLGALSKGIALELTLRGDKGEALEYWTKKMEEGIKNVK